MCWLDSDYDKTRLRSFSPRLYSAMHPAGRWADPQSVYTYCKQAPLASYGFCLSYLILAMVSLLVEMGSENLSVILNSEL